MAKIHKRPEVIDFFCGAGGFSEGFRQQGFKVIMGIDNWKPAIETHNLNHHLNDVPRDVLEFESLEKIEALPDTEVIVGSPPCVLFSMSNKGGNADKTLGIRLIEAYLRVVAVKKHRRGSRLKAWFLENVPNSKNYIKPIYTFEDLGLERWAKAQGKKPGDVALDIGSNSGVLNAADYGAPQKRLRFVCGEVFKGGGFITPRATHTEYVKLGDIKSRLPKPNSRKSSRIVKDPNYPSLSLPADEVTDHFYDTGIYESLWMNAKDYKLNHPYMGKMSFPEDETRPSRTIMATKSMSSRESIIYPSEYGRKGDGEYRLPTIREIACLMGYPIAYQFAGGEGTKWAQIGNAVPAHLSAALAKTVRASLGLPSIPTSRIDFSPLLGNRTKIVNLNTYSEKKFDNPPKKKAFARFRKHPFKDGNMTVALTNYHPENPTDRSEVAWYTSVFYGTGKGFRIEVLPEGSYKHLERLLIGRYSESAQRFVEELERALAYSFGTKSDELQEAYVKNSRSLNPAKIVDEVACVINRHDPGELYSDGEIQIAGASRIPARQLMAMYALNRIVS